MPVEMKFFEVEFAEDIVLGVLALGADLAEVRSALANPDNGVIPEGTIREVQHLQKRNPDFLIRKSRTEGLVCIAYDEEGNRI